MTQTLPGADIRGFYDRLEIALPGWSRTEAPTRCFADPDAHTNGDRDPSVSINLTSGAWHCHGCGARGGAFDAAIARGHSPRSAIDLMIRFGLTERRAQLRSGRELIGNRNLRPLKAEDGPAPTGRRAFAVTELQVRRWAAALECHSLRIHRLTQERGWHLDTLRELELGLDRDRITIPIRNQRHELQGLLRYQPDRTSRPKMLAAPGSRLGLIPNPAAEPAEELLLVEGPPDMITARSCGACAIAVPGDHAWQPSWAQSLKGRHITIVMDCDPAGRAAAERIARDLTRVAKTQIVDLVPDRHDGYDLTDWLMEGALLHEPASWLRHRRIPPTQGAAS